MTMEAGQASQFLAEVERVERNVRRSVLYRHASAMLMLWGCVTAVGYTATYLYPTAASAIWLVLGGAGLLASLVLGLVSSWRSGVNTFDARSAAAFVVFVGFGIVWSVWLGQFTPRQLGAFWPSYFMLPYIMAGLWLGRALVLIGVGVVALTALGYAYAGALFLPWMAIVNGGGLLLGGAWMRRN
jgi:hypothetical protein